MSGCFVTFNVRQMLYTLESTRDQFTLRLSGGQHSL